MHKIAASHVAKRGVAIGVVIEVEIEVETAPAEVMVFEAAEKGSVVSVAVDFLAVAVDFLAVAGDFLAVAGDFLAEAGDFLAVAVSPVAVGFLVEVGFLVVAAVSPVEEASQEECPVVVAAGFRVAPAAELLAADAMEDSEVVDTTSPTSCIGSMKTATVTSTPMKRTDDPNIS